MILYISNYAFHHHKPLQKRISTLDYKNKRIWTIGLQMVDPFIINSYHFDRFIFFIDYTEIGELWNIQPKQKAVIVVKNCTDEADVLYQIGTDFNMNVTCYFVDAFEEVVDEILM